MKPMWAALFPELTARHAFIGYSDHDILLGNLAAEVAQLRLDDDMLTPMAWYPQPLTNGNLLLVRTTPKMVEAFRRSAIWRTALQQRSIWVFDEHWGAAVHRGSQPWSSMHHVYHNMLLGGELRVRPSRRLLSQDIVFIPGQRKNRLYPTIASFGATATFTWDPNGSLTAHRSGPCVCSAQVWDIDLGSCAECLTRPGRVHTDVHVSRTVEVLGFHFQVFKSHWRARSRQPATLSDYVPSCGANASSFEACASLVVQPRLATQPATRALRSSVSMQFKGPDEPKGLTRENEPEEFFTSSFEELSDAEKLKNPGVIIGLIILIAPFIAGSIALLYYR